MNKPLLLFAMLLAATLSRADVIINNFETGAQGWTNVECYTAWAANDYKTGINLSNYAYFISRSSDNYNWAGALLSPCTYTGYRYVHAYMYRNNTNKPNLKFFDSEPAVEIEPMNAIVANEWQDVVFDLGDYAERGIDFLFFMVDRTNITQDAWMFIDEVLLSNDATPRTEIVGGDEPDNPEIPVTTDEIGSGTEDGAYTLQWADYFVGSSLNLNAWNIETNGDGGGNNELQYYCDRGVSVGQEPVSGKSCLILTATKENYMGKGCTSGRINSLGKVYFTHGKIEASIKLPSTANGLWPAYWMMGNDFPEVSWPACGETDILEMGNIGGIQSGTQDRFLNGASHWGVDWNDHRSYATTDCVYSYSVQDGQFHLFTCIWDEQKVAMYIDLDRYPNAQPYYVMTIPASGNTADPGYYFHKRNFLIFNLAVGGTFPQIWNVNDVTALANGPRSMYVDYVLVYQKTKDIYVAPGAEPTLVPTDPEETQALEEIYHHPIPTKFLHNGNIIIYYQGRHLDLLGRPIQ